MRVQLEGKRLSFTTGTGNKEQAARIAAIIYGELIDYGIDATLAKRKPDATSRPPHMATIGEYIAAAQSVSTVTKGTFIGYARALRKIAGDVLEVERTKKRFGKGVGMKAYRSKIDKASLEILTTTAIHQWRKGYIEEATDNDDIASRKTSCNATLRQARSLFADKIIKYLTHLHLPDPLPFTDVEYYPRQRSDYHSKIDGRRLFQEAQAELAPHDPAAFLVVLLAITTGLRRGEIDTIKWDQIDFTAGLIRIEQTDVAHLKTASSRGEIPISDGIATILQGHRAKARSHFVIDSPHACISGNTTWGKSYRVQPVFDRVLLWLRKKGVTAQKPLHELRKEYGAMITDEYGIYAASRMLRHADVSTTARYYTDLKKRPVLDFSQPPEGAEPESNIIPMKEKKDAPADKRKRKGNKA